MNKLDKDYQGVFSEFKLYLTSYCLSDFIYDFANKKLVKSQTKHTPYVNDVSIAKDFMDKISDSKTVEEIEFVARKIGYRLKKQKKK